jgi:hypothetical protein
MRFLTDDSVRHFTGEAASVGMTSRTGKITAPGRTGRTTVRRRNRPWFAYDNDRERPQMLGVPGRVTRELRRAR